MITLTTREREKFAKWCEQRARDNQVIADRTAELPGIGTAMARLQRNEALALTAVAMLLQQIETENEEG